MLFSLATACTTNNGDEQQEMEGSVATPPELMPAPDSLTTTPPVTDTVPAMQDTVKLAQ